MYKYVDVLMRALYAVVRRIGQLYRIDVPHNSTSCWAILDAFTSIKPSIGIWLATFVSEYFASHWMRFFKLFGGDVAQNVQYSECKLNLKLKLN